MSDELIVIGPDGLEHDLAWLQANYGTGLHVAVLAAKASDRRYVRRGEPESVGALHSWHA
jgi:hypothetical protein